MSVTDLIIMVIKALLNYAANVSFDVVVQNAQCFVHQSKYANDNSIMLWLLHKFSLIITI